MSDTQRDYVAEFMARDFERAARDGSYSWATAQWLNRVREQIRDSLAASPDRPVRP